MGSGAEKLGQRDGRRDRHVRYWCGAALAVLVAVGIAFGWRFESAPVESSAKLITGTNVASAARRETRPTLDPDRFVGKAGLAHQVARDIPDVLDQLYCYCECDKHVGHRSLLSCYTDGHAAT